MLKPSLASAHLASARIEPFGHAGGVAAFARDFRKRTHQAVSSISPRAAAISSGVKPLVKPSCPAHSMSWASQVSINLHYVAVIRTKRLSVSGEFGSLAASAICSTARSIAHASYRRAGRGEEPLWQVVALNADAFALTLAPMIAALRSAGVSSLRGITEAMNERGILSRRGGQWHVSNVRNLLMRLEQAREVRTSGSCALQRDSGQ